MTTERIQELVGRLNELLEEYFPGRGDDASVTVMLHGAPPEDLLAVAGIEGASLHVARGSESEWDVATLERRLGGRRHVAICVNGVHRKREQEDPAERLRREAERGAS